VLPKLPIMTNTHTVAGRMNRTSPTQSPTHAHTQTHWQLAQLALKLCDVWVPGYSVMRGRSFAPPRPSSFFIACSSPGLYARLPAAPTHTHTHNPTHTHTHTLLTHTHTHATHTHTHTHEIPLMPKRSAAYLSMLALKFAFRMTTHRRNIRGHWVDAERKNKIVSSSLIYYI